MNKLDIDFIKGKKVYLSIDIDVIDPKIFPFVTTPISDDFKWK